MWQQRLYWSLEQRNERFVIHYCLPVPNSVIDKLTHEIGLMKKMATFCYNWTGSPLDHKIESALLIEKVLSFFAIV